eukprot:3746159-Pleurochrysis_carterae.AAC.3
MSLNKLQLKDVDVSGKRVLIRVDFNVPQVYCSPAKSTSTSNAQLAVSELRSRSTAQRKRLPHRNGSTLCHVRVLNA